mmetsp:Transcript_3710/g.17099  ORF Transcript_3710/g.17099 Transcript_3710/m.17099 type:complete len:310 (-) Transcript_3710:352-1281(-)
MMISISVTSHSTHRPFFNPPSLIPMISTRCKSVTRYPTASSMRRIWRLRPSLSVISIVRLPVTLISHGSVLAVSTLSTLSRCTGVDITTPLDSVFISRGRISVSTDTAYVLSCLRPERSAALGSRPSLVSSMSPVLSLSSLPTGNKRACVYPTASMMLDLSRTSVVHVTPRGFQYLTYLNCVDNDVDGPAVFVSSVRMTFSVSHSTVSPFNSTTSPGTTLSPDDAVAPLIVTRPDSISLSALRREVKSLKHLLTRIPPTWDVSDVEWAPPASDSESDDASRVFFVEGPPRTLEDGPPLPPRRLATSTMR